MGLNLSDLRDAIAQHGPLTRVLIADHQGSTPREAGTSMLVWADGQSGTIGGGALEQQVTDFARTISKPTALNIPLGPALGQCCGGNVAVVFEPFTLDTLPPDTGPYIRKISGSSEQPLAFKRLLKSLRNSGQAPSLIWLGGWLLEPLTEPKTPLWLYGAGHVGRAIVDTLADMPFEVTWIDTSADRFPSYIPPHANYLIAQNPTDAVKHAPANAHHLVLTYSHALDLDLCHAILSRDHASLGLIGSKTKRARFSSKLSDLGHSSAQIASMICPIGQRDLGKTPKAIAIGVAAELLKASATQSANQRATA
ncbi:xanthine dehydrogenase accessory protein XdhC [Amylibacter sp. IMCC11727]|uniref:xanthine dehydrogenase accessory protein XdhC n=1 Tax=Amylibacter sp. IMCC11727 TaxID=3039851 RepID=UPI00244DB23C|nr:xanthine dehydrogenase accessory protein XdhC [Amylibacter sp. IMCC11727]WGI21369.1 xanthine dehydrogenase accessory protein XdhC [Amylibacter sp. IMCC11727]